MIATVYLVSSLEAVKPETMFDGAMFMLPDGETFQFRQSNGGGELGGIWSSILSLATPFANFIPVAGPFVSAGLAGLQGLLGANSVPGQAKGLASIDAFGGQVLAKFDELGNAAANCKIAPADAYKAADEMVAILSNPQAVYQAQKGKDAAALAGFKSQAAEKAQQVKAAIDRCVQQQQQQPGTQTQIINGQVVTTPVAGGIDTTTLLLLGGVGLLVVFLVMK